MKGCICKNLYLMFISIFLIGESCVKQVDNIDGFIYEKIESEYVYFTWLVNVGIYDQNRNEQEFAHLLEHVIVNNLNSSYSFQSYLESIGGFMQAFTSYDATTYEFKIPDEYFYEFIEKFNQSIKIEQISLNNLELSKKQVINEINYRKNRFEGRYNNSKYFEGNNYSAPIISNREVVEGIKVNELYEFYRKWYHNNYIFIVVGDIDDKKVKRELSKYLKLNSNIYNKHPRNVKVDDYYEYHSNNNLNYIDIGFVLKSDESSRFSEKIYLDILVKYFNYKFSGLDNNNKSPEFVSIGSDFFYGNNLELKIQVGTNEGQISEKISRNIIDDVLLTTISEIEFELIYPEILKRNLYRNKNIAGSPELLMKEIIYSTIYKYDYKGVAKSVSFRGFTNFYERFKKNSSTIVSIYTDQTSEVTINEFENIKASYNKNKLSNNAIELFKTLGVDRIDRKLNYNCTSKNIYNICNLSNDLELVFLNGSENRIKIVFSNKELPYFDEVNVERYVWEDFKRRQINVGLEFRELSALLGLIDVSINIYNEFIEIEGPKSQVKVMASVINKVVTNMDHIDFIQNRNDIMKGIKSSYESINTYKISSYKKRRKYSKLKIFNGMYSYRNKNVDFNIIKKLDEFKLSKNSEPFIFISGEIDEAVKEYLVGEFETIKLNDNSFNNAVVELDTESKNKIIEVKLPFNENSIIDLNFVETRVDMSSNAYLNRVFLLTIFKKTLFEKFRIEMNLIYDIQSYIVNKNYYNPYNEFGLKITLDSIEYEKYQKVIDEILRGFLDNGISEAEFNEAKKILENNYSTGSGTRKVITEDYLNDIRNGYNFKSNNMYKEEFENVTFESLSKSISNIYDDFEIYMFYDLEK